MKSIFFSIFSLLILSCSDNDNKQPIAEIDKLPPATLTGANTFGCLLDGKAYKPDNGNNSLQCYYQYVDGSYHFYIRGSNYTGINGSSNMVSSVYVISQKKQIFEGGIYDLVENLDGNIYGAIGIGLTFNTTSQTMTGKLSITKLDQINYIVSGTFWFDIIDNEGIKHEIRDGRFDMQYTN